MALAGCFSAKGIYKLLYNKVMNSVLKGIAILAVIIMIVLSVIFYAGGMDLDVLKMSLLILSIVWFVVAPIAWRSTQTEH